MLRVLVVSDTHGRLGPVQYVVEQLGGEVDLILHAGDHYRDADSLAYLLEIPARGVIGNCDWPGDGPLEDILVVGGNRIFLTHGHRYGVKGGTGAVLKRAKELKAKVAIYGHTHIAELQEEDGIIILNPGSPVQPRGESRASVGLLEIDGDEIKAELYYIDYFYP